MVTPGAISIAQLPHSVHDDRLITHDVSESVIGAAMGPFLFVSLFTMRAPMFPPHPHAGFSVATYLLPESPIGFLNQDSLGHRNRIAPGALHITLAGSGVLHEEQPERMGSVARGFQIWIDHADADRERPPSASHLAADAMPQVVVRNHTIRAVAGEVAGARSPAELAGQVRILDLEVGSGSTLELPLDAADMAFVVVHAGSLRIGDAVAEAGFVAATVSAGATLALQATHGSARATLFAGPATSRRRVRHGPFVASDDAQMQRFIARYHAGHFGSLRPFAAADEGTAERQRQ